MSREQDITDILQPVVESMGFIWWGVEYHHNSVNSILRVYVDKADGGISIDDIVDITDQLNPVLDVENPIVTAYTFEVSSPGMDRPLFTPAQFQQFVGATIKCQTRQAVEKRRKFEGVLLHADEEAITLQLPKGQQPAEISLPLSLVDKAKVVPEF